jgi:NAD(P) transhydrogenase subunit beta
VVAIIASCIIGAVTFSGSIVAWGKLWEFKRFDRLTVPMQKALNGALGLAVLAVGAIFIITDGSPWAYWIVFAISLALGVYLTSPIGGADMPVVIALLNSYSGLAAAATGFVIDNTVLIIAGSLVGASGIILTKIMCDAMNRSLTNVLFGVMAPAGSGPTADEVYAGKVKSASAEEIAMVFDGARRVVIVPGYGMAVAQAQHAVRDLASLLESRGATVEYAIHPVAGRMPGHMNVLLAEADVPYDKLKEMDEINSEISQVDVALIIGANDTVNPAARTDPASPIAGMPIVNVDLAKTVVVIKRSLSPGFAGIPNPLFAAPNTLMYFGDGKKAVVDLINAVKES